MSLFPEDKKGARKMYAIIIALNFQVWKGGFETEEEAYHWAWTHDNGQWQLAAGWFIEKEG